MPDLARLFDNAVTAAQNRARRRGQVGKILEAGGVQITVPGKPGRIYVRLGEGADGVIEAWPKGINYRAHAYVKVHKEDGEWVAESDLSATNQDFVSGGTVAPHTHRRHSGNEYVMEAELIAPGIVLPSSGLTVSIGSFRYPNGTTGETYEGGTIDLTSNLPATTGKWAWIVIGVNPATNTAVAVTGSEFDLQSQLTRAEIDNVAFTGYIPLAAIQANEADTTLNNISRYYDAKTWYVPSDMIDQDIFWLLAGRSGGQTAYGGTGPGDDVIIESTSDVTKGDVIIQPNGGNVGVGLTPTVKFETYLDGETYVERSTRQTIETTNARSIKKFIAKSEGDMVDGFGPTIDFGVNDTGAVEVLLGRIGAIRDGADTEGALIFQAGTNGVEEFMRVSSSGKVGIGGTPATHKLEIVAGDVALDNNQAYRIKDTGGTARGMLFMTAGDIAALGPQGGTVTKTQIHAGLTSSAITVDAATQRVGIGTDTPGTLLNVIGSQAATLVNIRNNTIGGDIIAGHRDNGTTVWEVQVDGSGNSLELIRDSAGAAQVVLRASGISSFTGGNVGIGTTGPNDSLVVNRNIADANRALFVHNDHASSTGAAFQVRQDGTGDILVCVDGGVTTPFVVRDGGRIGIGTGTPGFDVELSAASATLAINATSGSGSTLRFVENGTQQWHLHYSHANDRFSIVETGVAEHMTILDASGFVGIGQTAPERILHIHNGTCGWLFFHVLALGSTAVNILAAGAKDVQKQASVFGNAHFNGVGSVPIAGGHAGVSETGTLASNGGNTLVMDVNADGSVDIRRSVGSNTVDVWGILMWQ